MSPQLFRRKGGLEQSLDAGGNHLALPVLQRSQCSDSGVFIGSGDALYRCQNHFFRRKYPCRSFFQHGVDIITEPACLCFVGSDDQNRC